ncbi:hypothetical protein SEA_ODYSSEY395_35 [Arthrobacter phage Odyssey395]|nr:hypothetical protein SEA_ODYSSEY395_35 [Arthrobacter phage Odyssey395]
MAWQGPLRSIHGGVGKIRLDIHEGAVRRYIEPGGEVAEILDSVAWDTKEYGVAYISNGHIRSGRLLRGMYYNRVKPEGPLTGFSRAGNRARHAIYFHEGTGPVITANGPFMIVPRNRRAANTNPAFSGAGAERYAAYKANKNLGKGVTGKKTVRGQRAKPFLQEGLRAAMASHGLI